MLRTNISPMRQGWKNIIPWNSWILLKLTFQIKEVFNRTKYSKRTTLEMTREVSLKEWEIHLQIFNAKVLSLLLLKIRGVNDQTNLKTQAELNHFVSIQFDYENCQFGSVLNIVGSSRFWPKQSKVKLNLAVTFSLLLSLSTREGSGDSKGPDGT